MSGTFAGKVVVVTGGADGGIGGAISRGLAEEGAEVVIVDIDERGHGLAAELGGRFIPTDLSDPAAGAETVAAAVERLDGLVNAAGVLESKRFPELEQREWEWVVSINAAAPLFLIQALFDRFAKGGAVVNVTAIEEQLPVALFPPWTTPIYAASKAGLGLLTKSLAPVLGDRGIRVNSVGPGSWAQPAEIADVALFLLSDDARYVTGTSTKVDGGIALGPQRGDEDA
jgi:2-deoxy-D-gluconate 3-dehydrogenase